MIGLDGIIIRWHVGTFGNELESVLDHALGLLSVDLVLSGARHHDIDVALEDFPRSLASIVLESLRLVVSTPTTLVVLDVHHLSELLSSETVWLNDCAVAIREGAALSAELSELLAGILSNVTSTGNESDCALDLNVVILHHLVEIIGRTIASCLWADE